MVHPSCRGFTIASKVLAGLATMEQHACALRLVRHVKGQRLRAPLLPYHKGWSSKKQRTCATGLSRRMMAPHNGAYGLTGW